MLSIFSVLGGISPTESHYNVDGQDHWGPDGTQENCPENLTVIG